MVMINDVEAALFARLRSLSLRMMKSTTGERAMIFAEPRLVGLNGKWMTKEDYARKVFSMGGYAEFVFVRDAEGYSSG
jgi:hypothetical protein